MCLRGIQIPTQCVDLVFIFSAAVVVPLLHTSPQKKRRQKATNRQRTNITRIKTEKPKTKWYTDEKVHPVHTLPLSHAAPTQTQPGDGCAVRQKDTKNIYRERHFPAPV